MNKFIHETRDVSRSSVHIKYYRRQQAFGPMTAVVNHVTAEDLWERVAYKVDRQNKNKRISQGATTSKYDNGLVASVRVRCTFLRNQLKSSAKPATWTDSVWSVTPCKTSPTLKCLKLNGQIIQTNVKRSKWRRICVYLGLSQATDTVGVLAEKEFKRCLRQQPNSST